MGSLESICPEWRNHWYAYWSIIWVMQRKSHVCRAMPRPYKASSATWSPYPTATCWGSRRCSDLPGHSAGGARDGPYRDLRLVLRWINGLYKGYVRGYPPKYGLIWYSTSILGSWNSHWLNFCLSLVKVTEARVLGESCTCWPFEDLPGQISGKLCLAIWLFGLILGGLTI